MKHHSKLVILGLAATLVMTSLTGCLHRKKTTYQTYMQNVLDVNYKGSFDGYVKDNDGSEEDDSLNNAETGEVDAIFDETAKVIYSKAKYEVSRAYKSGSDYYVDVTVYPMDILNQAFDDVFAYIDDYNKKISAGDFNNTTKEDYEKEFAQGVSDILQNKAADMDYRSPVVVSVKITDDGDYYCADPAGLSQIDASMLAIEGSQQSSGSDSSDSSSEDSSDEGDISSGGETAE